MKLISLLDVVVDTYNLVPDWVYHGVGVIILWGLLFSITVFCLGFLFMYILNSWRDFWMVLADYQWKGYNLKEGELPEEDNLRKSYIYSNIARPYKKGIKGLSWEEYKESIKE